MQLDDEPDYPRGFLLATSAVTPPDSFERGPALPNFWIHPWTSVGVAQEGTLVVAVIGVCVPTFESPVERAPEYLLGRLQQNEESLLAALSDFVGRYAVIFGSVGHLKIVNDAIGFLRSGTRDCRFTCTTGRRVTRGADRKLEAPSTPRFSGEPDPIRPNESIDPQYLSGPRAILRSPILAVQISA